MSTNSNQTLIVVGEFVQKWSELLPTNILLRKKEKLKKLASSDHHRTELAKRCDPTPLFGDDKLSTILSMNDLLAPQLFSIDYLKQKFTHTTSRPFSDSSLLFNIEEWLIEELAHCKNTACTRGNEAVITVHLFVPIPQRKRSSPTMHQELMILSSQSLLDLRKAIVCSCDFQRIGEFGTDPDAIKYAPIAKEHYTSSFFYIENTFYDDCSNTETELSKDFIQWIESSGHSCKSVKMSDTQLSSLSIVIGRPYLFCHIGGACEHIVVFSDIRMRSPDDIWKFEKYPIQSYRQRVRFENCFICKRLYSCWLIKESSLVIDDPCLMCDICFKSSHYDEYGKRLDDKFKAYHFSQKS